MAAGSRYIFAQLERDLLRKMVFVAGPRQVGKTTLARSLKGAERGYMNWDIAEDRSRILAREFPSSRLWIFDEIHKYRMWRGLMKGLYDGRRKDQRILVTGSARLDLYRHGGDSLQGRYHMLRLHPLSFAELEARGSADFKALLELGGFPEPYFGGSSVEARRWSREYRTRLVREEVSSLEQVQDLDHLELLTMRLPELVGAPLSINAVREDLQVSHKTLAKWLRILERLYAIFRLPPLAGPRIRALKQAQKHYHFDWSVVPTDPQRFENMIASHLLKWVHFEQDVRGVTVHARARELERLRHVLHVRLLGDLPAHRRGDLTIEIEEALRLVGRELFRVVRKEGVLCDLPIERPAGLRFPLEPANRPVLRARKITGQKEQLGGLSGRGARARHRRLRLRRRLRQHHREREREQHQ